MTSDDKITEKFYNSLGTSFSKIKKVWLMAKLTGNGNLPKNLSTDEMLQEVASTAGAIGFIPAENILHGSCHNVMYSWHPISGWRTFEKGESFFRRPLSYTLFKDASFFPKLKNFLFYFWPIEFRECRIHKIDIAWFAKVQKYGFFRQK